MSTKDALEKCCECSKGTGKEECNRNITFSELYAILLALGEPEPIGHDVAMSLSNRMVDIARRMAALESEDRKELKIGGYQELAIRITETNRRIGGIEERMGTTNMKPLIKARVEAIESRLSALELSFKEVSPMLVK